MKSIKSVLLLFLAVFVVALLVLHGSARWSSHRMQAQARQVFVAKDVTADVLPPPLYLIEARLVLSQALEGTLAPAAAIRGFDALAEAYRARAEHWRTHPPYGLERELLGEQHEAALRFFEAARAQVLQPLHDGHADAARAALPAVQAHYEAHRRGVDRTVERSNAFADEKISGFDDIVALNDRNALMVLAGAVLASALLFALVWWRLQRDVVRPLQQASGVAARIATGDLCSDIVIGGRDEAAQVLQALVDMQAGLRRVVGEVRDGADGIATASAQIAQGNMDLSDRTEQQAANLQQTAAALHQIDTSVRGNAEHARLADSAAAEASQVADHGGTVVTRVVTTMNEIGEAAARIGTIVGVIDGIALQTNILALNAAVEAARSGEHGRGFSVVAGEVRSLSQRCAEAARQIRGLVAESTQRIEEGHRLADEAGSTMQRVVSQFAQVSSLISQISGASRQQTQGVGQVNNAVQQLDGVTQQNAALVEESAAAAGSLSAQAQRLAGAVSVFRLEGLTA
jgi:methyl-accepting chemotaxis protein